MTTKASGNDELYQVLLELSFFIFKTGSKTRLLCSLFNNDTKQFICEEYRLDISVNNFPLYGDAAGCRVLFKNITKKELTSSDIHIVCKMYIETSTVDYDLPKIVSQHPKDKNKYSGWKDIADKIYIPCGCCIMPFHRVKNAVINEKVGTDKYCTFVQETGESPIWLDKSVSGAHAIDNDTYQFSELHSDIINRKKENLIVAPMSIGIRNIITIFKGSIDKCENMIANYIISKYSSSSNSDAIDSLTFIERIDDKIENFVAFGEINEYHVTSYRQTKADTHTNTYTEIKSENKSDHDDDEDLEEKAANMNLNVWLSAIFGGDEKLCGLLVDGYFGNNIDCGNSYKFRDVISIVVKYIHVKTKYHVNRIHYRHLLYFIIKNINCNSGRYRDGSRSKGRSRSRLRNILVRIELRNNKTLLKIDESMFIMGKNCQINCQHLLSNCIDVPIITWNNEPVWNQLYCLVLDYNIEFLKNLHFYFQFYNLRSRSRGEIEGYSFLKLWNNDINLFNWNGKYNLQIYPIDFIKDEFNYLSQSGEKFKNTNTNRHAPYKPPSIDRYCCEIQLNWKSDII